MPKTAKSTNSHNARIRCLRFETLEPRLALAMMAIQVDEIEPINDAGQALPEGVLWEAHGSLGQDDLDYYSLVVGNGDQLQVSIKSDGLEYLAEFNVNVRATTSLEMGNYAVQEANGEFRTGSSLGETFELSRFANTSSASPNFDISSIEVSAATTFTGTHKSTFIGQGGQPHWELLDVPETRSGLATIESLFRIEGLSLFGLSNSAAYVDEATEEDRTEFIRAEATMWGGALVNANYSGTEFALTYDSQIGPLGHVSPGSYAASNLWVRAIGDFPDGPWDYSLNLDADNVEIWRFDPDYFTPYAILIDPNGGIHGVTDSQFRIDNPTPGEWKIAVSKNQSLSPAGDELREFKRPYTLDVSLGPVDLSVDTSGGYAEGLDEIFVDVNVDGVLPETSGGPVTTLDLYWATEELRGDISPDHPSILGPAFESIDIFSDMPSLHHVVSAEDLSMAPAEATWLVAIVDPDGLVTETCADNNADSISILKLGIENISWNLLRHDADEQAAGRIWRGIDVAYSLEQPNVETTAVPQIDFYWASGTAKEDRIQQVPDGDWKDLDAFDAGFVSDHVPIFETGTYRFNEPALWGEPPTDATHIQVVIGTADEGSNVKTEVDFSAIRLHTEEEIFAFAINPYTTDDGTGIRIDFTPGSGLIPLSAAEVSLGVHHFNWLQEYDLPVEVIAAYVDVTAVARDEFGTAVNLVNWTEREISPPHGIGDLAGYANFELWPTGEIKYRGGGNLGTFESLDRGMFYLNENSDPDDDVWLGVSEWQSQVERGGTQIDSQSFVLNDRPSTTQSEAESVDDYRLKFRTRIVGIRTPTISGHGVGSFTVFDHAPLIRWESTLVASTISGGDPVGGIENINVGGLTGAQIIPISGGVENIQVVVQNTLIGDYNQSGEVDLNDYVVWKNQYGTTAVTPGSGADGNFDGVVNAADYTVWRDNLGAGTPPGNEGAGAVAPVGASAGSSSIAVTDQETENVTALATPSETNVSVGVYRFDIGLAYSKPRPTASATSAADHAFAGKFISHAVDPLLLIRARASEAKLLVELWDDVLGDGYTEVDEIAEFDDVSFDAAFAELLEV